MDRACNAFRLCALLLVAAICGCTSHSTVASQPGAATLPASQASVKPGINAPYLSDPSIPRWEGVLETESREVYRERQRIVNAIGLKPGQCVADVGAGTGLFTLLFARAVGPQGEVIAVDIIPEFLEHIRKRADLEGLKNVTRTLGQDQSTQLKPGSVDVVFLCDAYHHFEYPQPMMDSILRALRPKGRLVVVDFERIPGQSPDWIFEHVRCGRATVIQEIQAGGFRTMPTANVDFLKENYMLVFRK